MPVLFSNVTTRYPYHDAHFAREGELPHDPIAAHPAFGNSFDWHSSVHSHWTAVHAIAYLDREGRFGVANLAALKHALAENLMPSKLGAELRYLQSHPAYERPYGWAWALALAVYVPAMREIAAWIAEAAVRWMTMLPMPVRHGVHSNTAFALRLMLDAAHQLHFDELSFAIADRARLWFERDRDWAIRYERSGTDFLSPGLTEADLMRAVLPRPQFLEWWSGFVPQSQIAQLVEPVRVPGVEDGHIVHLHGLNLSRSAQLARIGDALGDASLHDAALTLYHASSARAYEGHYTETHWLPTFAWDAAMSLDR
ncbi:MAG TPA: DUF2891 family protein [Candidatus Aquilonibacter sp.]|nr:DUF2891 family protein [Candidatus Aquilonibacter sp.]